MAFARLCRLVDPWSVPHFLFGMVVALGAITVGWPLLTAFSSLIVAALLWEYFERKTGLHEAPGNPWMDVFLSLIAFALTLVLVDRAPLHDEQHLALFVSVTLLFAFTNAAAWRARVQKDRQFYF